MPFHQLLTFMGIAHETSWRHSISPSRPRLPTASGSCLVVEPACGGSVGGGASDLVGVCSQADGRVLPAGVGWAEADGLMSSRALPLAAPQGWPRAGGRIVIAAEPALYGACTFFG